MKLWILWFDCIYTLRGAFSRVATFHWFVTATMAMTCRNQDMLGGVTSLIRSILLSGRSYQSLRDFFHSNAVNLFQLRQLWHDLVLRVFPVVLVNGRSVLVADGIKIAKAGKKMPGVKLLHQESQNNSKPEFIMGHMWQAVGILIQGVNSVFSCPLACEIHEGIVFSNRDRRTLHTKLLHLVNSLAETTLQPNSYYLVTDAYYANQAIIKGLGQRIDLISRVRHNTVAHHLPCEGTQRRRGRPKKYGKKVKLFEKFTNQRLEWTKLGIPDGRNIELSYCYKDLLWKPAGKIVRFVWVSHPDKGKMILVGTDLNLCAEEMIRIYILRFKIEVSFQELKHTFGGFFYRFWMKALKPIKKGSKAIYPHKESAKYREQIRQKIRAYQLYAQVAMIAQGLCQLLSCQMPQDIYSQCKLYFRTLDRQKSPSEKITAKSLEDCKSEFLQSKHLPPAFTKFLHARMNLANIDTEELLAA